MVELAEDASGREIELALGQQVAIRLPENRTTGFQWDLESSGKPVCVLVNDAVEGQTGAPGQGATHLWKFRAARPGQGTIALAYRRPWERQAAPAQTFTVRVRVPR